MANHYQSPKASCQICGSVTRVIDTSGRGKFGGTRRRRECKYCKSRFTTIEITLIEYKELLEKERAKQLQNLVLDFTNEVLLVFEDEEE